MPKHKPVIDPKALAEQLKQVRGDKKKKVTKKKKATVAAKPRSVGVGEEDYRTLTSVKDKFGITYSKAVSAMISVWQESSDAQKAKALGLPYEASAEDRIVETSRPVKKKMSRRVLPRPDVPTKLYFILTLGGEMISHSKLGPLTFLTREDADKAAESGSKAFGYCSIEELTLKVSKPDPLIMYGWKPFDHLSSVLPEGGLWFQEIRDRCGVEARAEVEVLEFEEADPFEGEEM